MLLVTEDGVKHLNIYSKAKTSLGKQLTNMYPFKFVYENIEFNSVEQAWHYYKFIDQPEIAKQILAMDNPFNCLSFARANKTDASNKVALSIGFKLRIEEVICTRIEADINLKNALRNSILPFEHYYAYGDKIHDQRDKYDWLIKIFENIRSKFQMNYLDDLLAKYGHLCYNFQTAPFNATYAGRPKSGQIAVYGNPFPINALYKEMKGTSQHNLFDIAVAKSVMEFRAHLIQQIIKYPEVWYQQLQDIKQKPLKCFCTNGTNSRDKGAGFCHTLILASFADQVDIIYQQLGIKLVK